MCSRVRVWNRVLLRRRCLTTRIHRHKTLLDIRKSMAAGATQQDRFFTQLHNSADGFSVVADFFGRGLMGAGS